MNWEAAFRAQSNLPPSFPAQLGSLLPFRLVLLPCTGSMAWPLICMFQVYFFFFNLTIEPERSQALWSWAPSPKQQVLGNGSVECRSIS